MNSLSSTSMNILLNFKATQYFKLLLIFSSVIFISACEYPENSNQGDSLAEGQASLTVTIPGLTADRFAQKNQHSVASRAGVPAEVTSLLIAVLNVAGEVLDSAEVIGTEGSVFLTIVAGDNYTIRGSAYAGNELLFQGESIIASLKAGTRSSVNLTLQDKIQLSLTSPGDIEIGVGATSINFDLTGLTDIAINWYVNGVSGGSAEVGIIDADGQYSPPAVLPINPIITITAEPVVAPSFAQSFILQLLSPDDINNNPIANAGVDQTVGAGATVILSAADSSDTDGTIVSYSWFQVSEDVFPVMNNLDLLETSFVAPSLTRDSVVIVELTVTDNDGATDTDSITILIQRVENILPQANAGVDQAVLEQTLVTLDGSASNDSDGSISAYSWAQTAGPVVTLSSASVASPNFSSPTITVNAILSFELTVVDNEGAVDTDSVTITVQPVNAAPVANAGEDKTVNAAVVVNLSAASSSDTDGAIVNYSWLIISSDLTPTLDNSDIVNPSFTSPSVQYGGFVTYRLTVTDNEGASTTDEITVTVNGTDQPLVANAGVDQIVDEATLVTLNGSASNDPDNDITTYLWEELSSGGVILSDASAQMPTFTAAAVTAATDYQFRLTVTNDNGDVDSDEITVTVNNVAVSAVKNYFASTTDGFNYNIWVTDGTDAGTFEVSSVATSNNNFAQYKTVNGFFYFQGNDGANGRELWRTDGTVAGTQMLPVAADSAYVGFGASYSADPTSFAVLGDRLLFGAATSFDVFRFAEYLSLDTTTDVLTSVFADGQPVISNPDSKHVGVFNGFVYFHYVSFSPVFSSALYRTDGVNPAEIVKSGFTSTFSHDFTEYNGELYFVSGNKELWKTDGTGPGTTLVKIFSGFVGYVSDGVSHRAANQTYFMVHNGSLMFVADGGEGRELWTSDGTPVGTVLLKDLDNTIASTNPTEFSLLNGQLIFFSSEGDGATDGIWTSDGTEAGTTRLLSLNVAADVSGYTGKETAIPTVIDGLNLLFFVADDGTGSELWKTDGTLAGTSMVKNIHTAFSSTPAIFKAGDGVLIFSAQDDDGRAKLWRSDGTDAGTTIIQDVLPSGFDNSAFFPAFD